VGDERPLTRDLIPEHLGRRLARAGCAGFDHLYAGSRHRIEQGLTVGQRGVARRDFPLEAPLGGEQPLRIALQCARALFG
jgi:hypothetical protein